MRLSKNSTSTPDKVAFLILPLRSSSKPPICSRNQYATIKSNRGQQQGTETSIKCIKRSIKSTLAPPPLPPQRPPQPLHDLPPFLQSGVASQIHPSTSTFGSIPAPPYSAPLPSPSSTSPSSTVLPTPVSSSPVPAIPIAALFATANIPTPASARDMKSTCYGSSGAPRVFFFLSLSCNRFIKSNTAC